MRPPTKLPRRWCWTCRTASTPARPRWWRPRPSGSRRRPRWPWETGAPARAAHAAFLEDAGLVGAAREAMARGESAGVAWRAAVQGYVTVLDALDDPLLAERADDLKDLERQVLLELSGELAPPPALPDNAIL